MSRLFTRKGPGVAASLREAHDGMSALLPTHLATAADVDEFRRRAQSRATTVRALGDNFGILGADRRIDDVEITVFPAPASPLARVVFLHGGGLLAGNRFDGVDTLLRHAAELELDIWTVEYPLAPGHTFAAMVRAATTAAAAAGVDGTRVLLAGQSAGGGIAAAAALNCRDLGIGVDGQLLMCPMLSRRDVASSLQYRDDPAWSAISNATGWSAALSGTPMLPPGERSDLAGLPPTYLDTGTAELFRDSIVGFATALWAQGCAAELHAWSGAFHASDCVAEDASVSIEAHRARREWLRRWLAGDL